MNYLGLTNYFLVETGISDPVASLVDVNDDIKQGAHWINSSWASFQRDRLWPFRLAEGTFNATTGVSSFTAAARGAASGDLIVPHSFYSPLGSITHVDYKMLRNLRRGAAPVDQGRVTHIAVNNGTLEVFPTQSATRAIAFDYWKGIQALVDNSDIPYGLPADFHSIITHLAVARYGVMAGGQEGANLFQHHSKEFTKMLNEYDLFTGVSVSRNNIAAKNTLL